MTGIDDPRPPSTGPRPASRSPRPRALVLRSPGTNCEREMARAFELAGARPEFLHLNRLLAEPALLEGFGLIGFPGGFSYGDDIAAGRVQATRLRVGLGDALRAARDRGVPMIGVCNGFQVLVKAGLLPGRASSATERDDHDATGAQTVSLIDNAVPRFQCRWVGVRVPVSRCVWTRGLQGSGGEARADRPRMADFELPIAHGEGRFVAETDELDRLEAHGQVALRYAPDPAAPDDEDGSSINGSARGIAGICDATGLIFGLMPHPERYVEAFQHPDWTRWPADERDGLTPGLAMFRAAVDHAAGGGAFGPGADCGGSARAREALQSSPHAATGSGL